MNTKEATAKLRQTLKALAVKCRVHFGGGLIYVEVPMFGLSFSETEQRQIRLAAIDCGLTHVRGLAIDPEQMTGTLRHVFQA